MGARAGSLGKGQGQVTAGAQAGPGQCRGQLQGHRQGQGQGKGQSLRESAGADNSKIIVIK